MTVRERTRREKGVLSGRNDAHCLNARVVPIHTLLDCMEEISHDNSLERCASKEPRCISCFPPNHSSRRQCAEQQRSSPPLVSHPGSMSHARTQDNTLHFFRLFTLHQHENGRSSNASRRRFLSGYFEQLSLVRREGKRAWFIVSPECNFNYAIVVSVRHPPTSEDRERLRARKKWRKEERSSEHLAIVAMRNYHVQCD